MDQARETYRDLLAKAEALRQQADAATGEAKAEAQDAGASIQGALQDLESSVSRRGGRSRQGPGAPAARSLYFSTRPVDLAPSG